MLRPLLIAATALLAVIPAAHGQSAPLTKAESNLAFSALGHTLTFPYPEWIDEAGQAETDPLPLFEVTNNDDGTKAEVDLLPKGEGKADWLHHYEARIVLMPERSLEQLR